MAYQPWSVIAGEIPTTTKWNIIGANDDHFNALFSPTNGHNHDGVTTRSVPPSGSIIMFAGSSIPAGYLPCDGRAISRTDYASLFSAIGTIYGTGNGSTTFNIPDARDRFPVMVGNSYGLNSKGGNNSINFSHAHSLDSHWHGMKNHYHYCNPNGSHSHTGATGMGNYVGNGASNVWTGSPTSWTPPGHNHGIGTDGWHDHYTGGPSDNGTDWGGPTGTYANLGWVDLRPPFIAFYFLIKT